MNKSGYASLSALGGEAKREQPADLTTESVLPGAVVIDGPRAATRRNRAPANGSGSMIYRDGSRAADTAPGHLQPRAVGSSEDLIALSFSTPTIPVNVSMTTMSVTGKASAKTFSEDVSVTKSSNKASGTSAAGHALPSSAQGSGAHLPMLRTIATLAAPISVSQVAQFSIMMFMLAAVGTIGVSEMGGTSIAFGLINATAFAFSSGLCGALETLLAQSFGRDPSSKLYGVYAQRMTLILALFAVPLSLCLANAEPLLVWMGEPLTVAQFAGRFCRTSALFAVGPVMALELLRRYYVSQRRPNPVFAAVVLASVVNPFIVYPAVQHFGYDGVAFAFASVTATMDVGLLAYLRVTGLYKLTWGGWSTAALQQWGPLLKLALPSLAMGLSEWTSLEANSVVAGFGTEVELAAYAVSSQIASLCWAVPSGVYMAATVLVGNSIGSGSPVLAQRFAKVTSFVAVALSLANCAAVLICGRWIAELFTEDDTVVQLFASRVGPWMLAYHFADTLSCNGLAILRGCGLHTIGMIIILSSLAVVGTPLGIFMFLRLEFGVEVLWIGPLLGYLIVGLPALTVVLFCRIEWRNLRLAEGEALITH